MFLERILEAKYREVDDLRRELPLPRAARAVADLPPARDFAAALRRVPCAVIAEMKRRSPSKGRLGDVPAADMIRAYDQHGATAVSVLTDRPFFGGAPEDLAAGRQVTVLPLLRKDFIVDPLQVYHSRLLGADAVLLIVRILTAPLLGRLLGLTRELGMQALVEVHNREGLQDALGAGADLVGINNRDLTTFSTRLATSLELAPFAPAGVTLVSASGIHTRQDIELLMAKGIRAFLVGEALMGAGDVGRRLRQLKGEEDEAS